MSAMTVEDTGRRGVPGAGRPGVDRSRPTASSSTRRVGRRRPLAQRGLPRTSWSTSPSAPADDRSRLWLVEGVAQYVARSTLPVDDRRRIAALELGGAADRTLEASRRFYTRDPLVNYALAALVCDYLATTRGEAVLWDLVPHLPRRRGSPRGRSPRTSCERELGLSTGELSAQALAWARPT